MTRKTRRLTIDEWKRENYSRLKEKKNSSTDAYTRKKRPLTQNLEFFIDEPPDMKTTRAAVSSFHGSCSGTALSSAPSENRKKRKKIIPDSLYDTDWEDIFLP